MEIPKLLDDQLTVSEPFQTVDQDVLILWRGPQDLLRSILLLDHEVWI
jgi:hypothetical protein